MSSSLEAGVDRDTLFQELGYKPRENQSVIHKSRARFRVPCCGRRWGKSLMEGHDLTARMFIPDAYYWIVGPTYALAEKEFRVVYHDLIRKLRMGKHVRASYQVKQGNMEIRMPWNTVLEVKSAEKQDSLVGEGLDHCVVSEAALHKADTWNMYLEPALSDKRGSADFPSTPRGYNWYQGLWEMGQSADFPDYESWRLPTWTNTISYPGGYDDPEMVRIRDEVSEHYWLQEYAAEFTAYVGKIYTDWNRTYHVKSIHYNPAWKNYWAFDFGYSAPFVCLDIMVDPSDNVYVWREYQVRHKSSFQHGMILKNRENPLDFHVDGMYGDPRGADEIATLALILGYILARDVPWIQGIEAVQRHLKLKPDGKPKLFVDPSCTELIRQMENLRTPDEKEGKNPREGQHDYDDHGPDALRYFFNEHFVLGAGGGLNDVYNAGQMRTEAATFFQQHSKITKPNSFIPFG